MCLQIFGDLFACERSSRVLVVSDDNWVYAKLSNMKHSYSSIPRIYLVTEDIDLVNQTSALYSLLQVIFERFQDYLHGLITLLLVCSCFDCTVIIYTYIDYIILDILYFS